MKFTMSYQKYIYILFHLYLGTVFDAVSADEACDKSNCGGPLAYYQQLGCSPIYLAEGDCCAVRYNCDHLNERSRNKCYVNGKEYAVGDSLKAEDANPCDIGCTCIQGPNGVAGFNCAVVDCFQPPVMPGCYRKNSPLSCCPGEEVCPENPNDRATCNVDGKIYREGDYFPVESEPDLTCVCQPGYTGQNVEPFCARRRRPFCDPTFRSASDVSDKCAPVYYSNQNPATDCSVFSRCQNSNDTVKESEARPENGTATASNMVCYFGNLSMNIGDQLNPATDYSSVCVQCLCQVPPTPTCQRLPDEKCDSTNHPVFGNWK